MLFTISMLSLLRLRLCIVNSRPNSLTSTDSDPTQPAPPLTLHYDGDDYILGSSHTVRQSKEQIPGVATQYAQKNVEVVTESLLDLESNQKSAVCLVSRDLPFHPAVRN